MHAKHIIATLNAARCTLDTGKLFPEYLRELVQYKIVYTTNTNTITDINTDTHRQ